MTTASLSLEHILKVSTITDKKAPVLFMFHGYGSDEQDLFSFAPELPEELCIISVKAPYPMQPLGNAWYTINFDGSRGKWNDEKQARMSRDAIVKFIGEACATYSLDKNNITLLGFSQGAILCYAVALSFPENVKNVVALSGYIDKNIFIEGYREKVHSNLQIYASHGQVDMVIPPEWAQKTPAILDNLGIQYVYEEFPVGHGVSPQNFESFKKWLKDKI